MPFSFRGPKSAQIISIGRREETRWISCSTRAMIWGEIRSEEEFYSFCNHKQWTPRKTPAKHVPNVWAEVTEPERIYNSHYGNGVPAIFTS